METEEPRPGWQEQREAMEEGDPPPQAPPHSPEPEPGQPLPPTLEADQEDPSLPGPGDSDADRPDLIDPDTQEDAQGTS